MSFVTHFSHSSASSTPMPRRQWLSQGISLAASTLLTPWAAASPQSDLLVPVRGLPGQAGTLRVAAIDTRADITLPDRALYSAVTKRFMAQAEAGDRLLLTPIANAGIDQLQAQSFNLAHTGRPVDGGKLKAEQLSQVEATIDSLLGNPGQGNMNRVLETLDALKLVVNAALANHMAVRVLLASDVIEHSPLASFEDQGLDEPQAAALLQKLRQRHLLLATPPEQPQGHDLQVRVVDSGGNRGDSYQSILRFWQAYVMLCGGQLSYYGHTGPSLA